MKIGLSGGASSAERTIEQAQRAEADGFSALWYASGTGGDPLVGMTLAGRATSSIELGTAVLQTYPTHPTLQAARALSVADAIGRAGFTLGIGPSHQPVIEDIYGLDYSHPGRHTEEYVSVLTPLLRGESVSFSGEDYRVQVPARPTPPANRVGLLVSALAPRLLRVAGEQTDGTVTWMANAEAIASQIAPRIRQAAADAGRPEPRIVVGLPVAVTDDEPEARRVAAKQFAIYGTLPNYRRILDAGGADGPADAAIVGDEDQVAAQIEALVTAGATDVWAAVFPVGDDPRASRSRTRDLLTRLVG
jgi:F420-dependent oxidoreductase-like protein